MPDNTEEDKKNKEEAAPEIQPFGNFDLREISVFGAKRTGEGAEPCWAVLAQQSKTLGWSGIDKRALGKSLAKAVDSCYFRLVSFTGEDLDNEISWHASFLNSKGLWSLEIAGSPRAEVEPEQVGDFFRSEPFKKIAKRAGWILQEARSLIEEVVSLHLEAGELMEVDEVKLAAILHWLSDKQVMENLRSGKFMSA